MKHTTRYLLLGVALITLVGCKEKTITNDMPDSEKLELLDIKLDKHPKDAELLAERTQVLLNLGRTREAQYDINRAVDLKPNKVEYRLLQADAYFAGGNIEDSYKSLSEAEKIAPTSQEVQLKMGEITYYGRDYDRSLESLSKVTEADPNNRTALFMKGFIYKEKGDTASAVAFLQKVCNLYPDYAPAFEELGILYSTRNNPMAVEYLSTASRLEPSNTNVMYALAMYYQDNEMFEQAEELYHKILDINETSADSWHNLGYIALFHYKDPERAIDYFSQAIDSDSQHIAAYANRAIAYELSGQHQAAREDYEAALAIDPEFQPALNGLRRVK